MRAEIFHHVSSFLSKYSDYSEADFTREVSQLLSSKANLTEALGVSGQLGGLMQATYEELMDAKVYELKSGGMTLVEPVTVFIILGAMVGFIICIHCCGGMMGAFDDLMQIHEGAGESDETRGPRMKIMKKAARKVFAMKFGKDSGADLQLCMDEVSSKGASLMEKAGLKPSKLSEELEASKQNPKGQVKIFRAAATAFMAHHGATIAEFSVLATSVLALTIPDFTAAIGSVLLLTCRTLGSLVKEDTFDTMAMSMKNTFAGLENLADSNSKLIEKLEDEESSMDESTVEKSELWHMMKSMQIVNKDAYVSRPWSPEALQLAKMPDASTFSMAFKPSASLYYKGNCIPEQDFFKKHDVAIVSASNAKVPKGTIVKLDRVVTTGRDRGAYFTKGEYQTRLKMDDISFGLIPVQVAALDWLAATNQSLPAIQDPSDPSKLYLLP